MDGKLPPQAIELEKGVLGSLLLTMEAINVVADILGPKSFYLDAHARIYGAVLNLFKQSIRCDPLSVMQELKKTGELEIVGGAYYISTLTNNESHQLDHHARIIQQKFVLREIIRISTESANRSYEESADCFEVLGALEKGLTELNKDFTVGNIKTIANLWNEVSDHNQVLLTKQGISGVPSGYRELDSITGGWEKSSLIILAARPAMGKTSLVCNFARNAAVDFNKAGIIFSLEMPSRQIATRIFSLESNVSNTDFMRRGIESDRMVHVENSCSKLINSPIYIDDTPALNITELRSKARKLKREKNIEWIIVDYLQLMAGDKTGPKGNREQEISGISRGLKALAKELEIPIIALSQLSRAVETRGGDKRPQLSDLRESGAIEQDADMVIFIHRPEYYNVMQDEAGQSTAGVAEIIFSKNRNGGTGTEKLRWIDYLTKFESFETAFSGPVKNNLQPNKNFETENADKNYPF